jgi:hypothetical protein
VAPVHGAGQAEPARHDPAAAQATARGSRRNVTVSTDDVRKLLAACEGWTERLTLYVAVYAGARRHALSQLRLSDFDRAEGKIRFREKGGKIIWKPIADELANLIEAAIAARVYKDGIALLADADRSADPYLIPPESKLQKVNRDDRVIWRVVKRVADRAGVETHVHALRAAFAVLVLEQFENPYMAQQALGHVNPQTTQVYLRKLDKQAVMEPLRDLSWDDPPEGRDSVRVSAGGPRCIPSGGAETDDLGALRAQIADLQSRLATAEAVQNVQSASPVVGAGGFEPPQPDSPVVEGASGTDLVGVLGDEARSVADQATREVVS